MKVALIPLKRLDAGKSRLMGALPREAIAELSLAMLGDVLEALAAVPELDHRVVVTPDPEVGRAAEEAGAEAMVRQDPGLNPSLDEATALLAKRGLGALLVVLGDVAGAAGEDLQALFKVQAELGDRSVVLAPSRDGGTAALLRTPFDVIPSRFGRESAAAHEGAARERDVPFRACELASLSVDLDRPDDLEALVAGTGPAPRTRALLRKLGLGGAR